MPRLKHAYTSSASKHTAPFSKDTPGATGPFDTLCSKVKDTVQAKVEAGKVT